MSSPKSDSERITEVKDIYNRLAALGITRGNTPELNRFWTAANEFVRHSIGSSGKVALSHVERRMEYQFATIQGRQTFAVIKYVGKRSLDDPAVIPPTTRKGP